MPRAQRIAQYIRQLAYESLLQDEERDDRPEDAPPRASESSYTSWNATSFAVYVPFRSPPSG